MDIAVAAIRLSIIGSVRPMQISAHTKAAP